VSEKKTPPLGALRERIELFSKQTLIDPDGGQDVAYVPLGSVWARVAATIPRRAEPADGVATTVTHTAVVRYRTDLSPGDRVTWRGRTLDIVGAEDLNGRRAYTVIRCTETTTAG